MYSFEFKIFDIAHHVQLPKPPKLGPRALALPPGERLPPILVINLQLPMYGVRPVLALDGRLAGGRGKVGCEALRSLFAWGDSSPAFPPGEAAW